jgi:hypothetical protein
MIGTPGRLDWANRDVKVIARAIPRYFWLTVSIDVYLEQVCILRTGGQLKRIGTQRNAFIYNQEPHEVELSWTPARLRFWPYRLSIDDEPVIISKVYVTNWPLQFIPVIAFLVALIVLSVLFPGRKHP